MNRYIQSSIIFFLENFNNLSIIYQNNNYKLYNSGNKFTKVMCKIYLIITIIYNNLDIE